MKELISISKKAEEALSAIEGSKEYPSFYVLSRLETAFNENPGDQLISNMRDVISGVSKNNEFISKKTIASIYDKVYGLSGGRTVFRDVLGDLLPKNHASLGARKASYARNRISGDPISLGEDKEIANLSDAFSSLFSLSSSEKPGLYSNDAYKKAERVAVAQLKSVGFEPQSIKAVKSNSHYILCIASYDTNNFKQVNVKIPVEIKGGSVAIPTKIIAEGGLVDLDKDNLYLYIKDSENHSDKIGVSKFSSQRMISNYRADKVVVPASLEKYADLDTELVVAASSFSRDEILMANSIVSSELASIGISNPQVKLSSSGENQIIFSASVPTGTGVHAISVPVEIHNGKPILPSKFSSEDAIYSFSSKGVRQFLSDIAGSERLKSFSRDGGEMSRMSYHELMDSVIKGVATKNYKLSEDALSIIQSSYSSDHYMAAMDKFSSMLRSEYKNEERQILIDAAIARGDLIITSTSIEPYCPKLGLTLKNIDFDSRGRPIPRGRGERNNNLRESGATMSTSKIVIT